MKPFKGCFATDADLSVGSFNHALKTYREHFQMEPTVLWIHAFSDAEQAQAVLAAIYAEGIEIRICESYIRNQWSVGNSADYGYGSYGA